MSSSLLRPAIPLRSAPLTSPKPSVSATPNIVLSSTLIPRSTVVQWPLAPYPPKTTAGLSPSLLWGQRRKSAFSTSAASSDWVGPEKSSVEYGMSYVGKLFDELPQPIKRFPWSGVLRSFLNLILELVLAVVKFLSLPVLAMTSLSEMSYCAHERRMRLIPIPLILGFTFAGVLKDAAVELSADIKDGDFPWHLLAIASLFLLLKLPGPYYPYWGRLLIPHFANGGLLRTLWFAFVWLRNSSGRDITTESP